MHQSVGAERGFPGERPVNALRFTVRVYEQVIRPCWKSQGWARQLPIGFYLVWSACGFLRRWAGLWKWRLVTETSGYIDGAQKHLKYVDGATGMEAV